MINDLNFLEGINFKMVLKRAPHLEFFSKAVTIPSISIAQVPVSTPFSTIYEHGDHITFAPLDFTFRIDQKMQNWTEIVTWMTQIGFPESYEQYGVKEISSIRKSPADLKSDIDVVLFSSKNNPIKTMTFKNAWPTDISGISIDIDQDNVTYLESTVTFSYDIFTTN